MNFKKLIEAAVNAKENAYVPYSGFRVGAAVLTKDGRIFTGCNVENAAYSPTNCAERTAIFKAVSEGCREFYAIAVTGDGEDYLPPCGVCRQVMAEFCEPEEFLVLLAKGPEDYKEYQLSQLFPGAFGKENLNR